MVAVRPELLSLTSAEVGIKVELDHVLAYPGKTARYYIIPVSGSL